MAEATCAFCSVRGEHRHSFHGEPICGACYRSARCVCTGLTVREARRESRRRSKEDSHSCVYIPKLLKDRKTWGVFRVDRKDTI